MMKEEVDWYFKQLDELRGEFAKEIGTGLVLCSDDVEDSVFNEKMVELLQAKLLTESQINEKYGIRLNSSSTHIRFREIILQVLMRLCTFV